MSATKYNFELNQGETFDTLFTITTADRRPFDLTNYDLRAQLRDTFNSNMGGAPLATFLVTSPDPLAGQVRLELDDATTSALSFTKAFYDIEAEHQLTGVVIRLLQGIVTLSREATV